MSACLEIWVGLLVAEWIFVSMTTQPVESDNPPAGTSRR